MLTRNGKKAARPRQRRQAAKYNHKSISITYYGCAASTLNCFGSNPPFEPRPHFQPIWSQIWRWGCKNDDEDIHRRPIVEEFRLWWWSWSEASPRWSLVHIFCSQVSQIMFRLSLSLSTSSSHHFPPPPFAVAKTTPESTFPDKNQISTMSIVCFKSQLIILCKPKSAT